MSELPSFPAEDVALVHDGAYHQHLHQEIRSARASVYAVQFIADLLPANDGIGAVRDLAHAFAEAAWRGVDVRIVLSRFEPDPIGYDVNVLFASFVRARGVAVREYVPRPGSARSGVHSKFVIVDDARTLLGSHNWTTGAFGVNLETSVAVKSTDVASRLTQTFMSMWWREAKGEA